MEIACRLQAEAKKQGGVEALPFAAVGQALEEILMGKCTMTFKKSNPEDNATE